MDELTAQFIGPAAEDFPTSPLYRALRPVVAAQPRMLGILAGRQPGQQAPYLFFAAVHHILLGGADHPLRAYFPSLVGDAARSPDTAGPALIEFCRRYEAELAEIVSTRLVQTNVVRRVIGLRHALALVAETYPTVHLVEVGASAGLHLGVDRYRYRLADRSYGPKAAAVTVDSLWRGDGPAPTLGPIPAITSRTGVDLRPIDATDTEQRRWLRALVWPENVGDAALLEAALADAAKNPPRIVAGDAIEVLPDLGRSLPSGEPCVVYHAATRMHVPAERRGAFDAAIDGLAERGPLVHVWQEPDPHAGDAFDGRPLLCMHTGREPTRPLVRMAGHGQWLDSPDTARS